MLSDKEVYRWKNQYISTWYKFLSENDEKLSRDFKQGARSVLEHLERNMVVNDW